MLRYATDGLAIADVANWYGGPATSGYIFHPEHQLCQCDAQNYCTDAWQSTYGTNNLAWFTRDDGCSNGNAYSWFTLDLGSTRHVLSFEFRPSAGGPGGLECYTHIAGELYTSATANVYQAQGWQGSYSTALSVNGFDPVALTASWAASNATTMQRIVIGRDARFLLYRMTDCGVGGGGLGEFAVEVALP